MLLPSVSVIIPVYDDAERLALCLEALERQTYPSTLYEVIVVDNASKENLTPVVALFGRQRLAREERPGSYAARNKGLSLATGEVIAFTDADCLPSADWIEQGVGELQRQENCGLVAGRVDIFPHDPASPTAVELYECVTALPQRQFIERGHFGATANLFTFKRIVEKVGPFDGDVKSGGDVEWGQRVAAFGYQLIYSDAARVAHPARHSFAELYKKVTRTIGGVHDAKGKKDRSFLGIDRCLLADLVPPLKNAAVALSDERLKSRGDKLKVVAVTFFVRYVEAWERIRLRLKGVSRR